MATLPTQAIAPETHHLSRKPLLEADTTSPASNPVELLRLAVMHNASIEQLTQLMDLQERWERREAKRAYDAAFKAFKLVAPTITKNARVTFEAKDRSKGVVDYDHATLDHVCDQVIALLAQHGFAHRWKFNQDKEWIFVTCILTHDSGHCEETTLRGVPDNTGSKNANQANASTVTYLERYTLLGACGLATKGQDNDGRGAAKNNEDHTATTTRLTTQQVQQLCSAIANARDMNDLHTKYMNAGHAAQRANDRAALAAFITAKDARKRELL